MENDQILLELIESLKNQNADLKNQLVKRPKPFIGLAHMWETFWTTLGGMWRDFWTSISDMWGKVWDSEASIFGFVVMTVIVSVVVGISSWAILDEPDPIPPPPAKLLNEYHIAANEDGYRCFYVKQKREDGSSTSVSPCIEDKDEALKLYRELQQKEQSNGS